MLLLAMTMIIGHNEDVAEAVASAQRRRVALATFDRPRSNPWFFRAALAIIHSYSHLDWPSLSRPFAARL
jgi:hypothetical protein